MKLNENELTHKGWFFMCPIYLNLPQANEHILVDARWRILDWWFDLNELIFGFIIFIMTFINPSYEPYFPFVITGELKNPIKK